MTLKPETAELVAWAQNWLTQKGYHIQERLPWRTWRYHVPTLIYARNDDGLPVFGLLAHLVSMKTLLKQWGILMNVPPHPAGIYVFLPINAPHKVEVELRGRFTYQVEVVESPSYPYDPKHYERESWESSFSMRLGKRDFESKE